MALSVAHNFEAARELLADLRGVPELAPYVLPEVYMQDDQDTAIASIAALNGIALAVGLAEDALPTPGEVKSGLLLHLGLTLYCFRTTRRDHAARAEELESIRLTALAYAARFSYVPKPHGTPIHALPQSLATVSLSDRSGYADKKLMAEALILNLPIKI